MVCLSGQVAGTIVTYIVILVQFDSNATGDDGPRANRTVAVGPR